MIGIHDPEGVEKQVLHGLIDFKNGDILEVGCGEGRMTWLYADIAASVLGIDPDDDAISTAREQTPEHLQNKVEFRVADIVGDELDEDAFDVGVLAWSI